MKTLDPPRARAEAPEELAAVPEHATPLDLPPNSELDRWTVLARAQTRAEVAGILTYDAGSLLARSVATARGIIAGTFEITPSRPIAEQLLERVHADGALPLCAQAPITFDGEQVGWLAVAGASAGDWSAADLGALDAAADAVSTALALRMASHETERVRGLLASHNGIHELIARAAPLQQVLDELALGIERYDPSVLACVVLLNRESSTLHPGSGPSLPPEWLAAIDGVVIGPNVGTCGAAAWSGRLTITADMMVDPKWTPVREFARGFGLRHCWSMPIKAPDGDVLGTLALYGTEPRLPQPEQLTLMRDGARLAGIAIERHRTMEKLLHDARHDGLTGLPNRTAIFERLDEAMTDGRSAGGVAVLFIDLDDLKAVNDTFGHDRADEMIREVGERIAACVRPNDVVGRLGGDEFVVIAEGIGSHDEAAEIGARLLDAISEPLPGVERAVVTASIGIALMRGSAADAREALREADSAMYMAKRAGRDRCSFFEGAQRLRTGRRLSIARELEGAETRGEMALAFQPVFELASLEIVGVEALLRWHSPVLGDVAPAEFVPVAEDTGAIVPIGAWVLRESCETVARLSAETGCALELGVNVSAHQVGRTGFVKSVRQTLAHSELPAAMLTLEITETALLRPDAVTMRALSDLEELGVRIVLDDFGTGYSSLAWLKRHPLDAIKIDRGFVSGLPDDRRDTAVVAGVIGIATALGCTVTAEGVETRAQLDALRVLGCERVQGYLLARPLPVEQLRAQLPKA